MNLPNNFLPALDAPLPELASAVELVAFSSSPFGLHSEGIDQYSSWTSREYVLAAVRGRGSRLQFASPDLRADKEIVLTAVSTFGSSIKYALGDLHRDFDVVLAAVHSGKLNFDVEVEEEFRSNPEIILAALKSGVFSFELGLDPSLSDNRDVILAAVQQKGRYLFYASSRLRADREVVMAALHSSGESIQFVDNRFLSDREVILASAFESAPSLSFASVDLRSDRELVLALCKVSGLNIQYADEVLRRDPEIVLAAVNSSGWSLKFLDIHFRADKRYVLAAVSNYGRALYWASHPLRRDREVVLAALSNYGLALEYADPTLRDDPEICVAALSQSYDALSFISSRLHQNQEVMLAALQHRPTGADVPEEPIFEDRSFFLKALKRRCPPKIHHGLLMDRKLMPALLEYCYMFFRWLPVEYRKDRDIVLIAVRQNGDFLQIVDPSLRRDREVVLAAVQQNGLSLAYASLRLRSNENFVEQCISADPSCYRHVHPSLRSASLFSKYFGFIMKGFCCLPCGKANGIRNLALLAVQNLGSNLKYCDQKFKNDREIVLAAVQNSGESLEFASSQIKSNAEVILAACRQSIDSLRHANLSRIRSLCFTIEALHLDFQFSYCLLSRIFPLIELNRVHTLLRCATIPEFSLVFSVPKKLFYYARMDQSVLSFTEDETAQTVTFPLLNHSREPNSLASTLDPFFGSLCNRSFSALSTCASFAPVALITSFSNQVSFQPRSRGIVFNHSLEHGYGSFEFSELGLNFDARRVMFTESPIREA